MAQTTATPKVRPGGLVTVAFLKARLDEGGDHLGIFMPLVLDVIAQLPAHTLAAADVQEGLATRHGLAMPQQTVVTLLKRAINKKYLERDSGRYRRTPKFPSSPSGVAAEKERIESGQSRLAEALLNHAAHRGLTVESTEAALDMLFRFLEDQQVALLLGSPSVTTAGDGSLHERAVVAEFIQDAIRDDPALRAVLRGILEGLVLYHAAFLPDLNASTRHFKDLRVFFDSVLVRQALGYEGTAMRILLRETVDVLKAGDVQCLVFDKTVEEIRRILSMYEVRVATEEGRRKLRPVPMARHFLTQRYSTSDVREMSALLEREIVAAGFQIQRMASHTREYTASERALAARLSDPTTKDELEPRVTHDVDCVAGILTLRRGHRSSSLEEARVVFATSSTLVIRNTRLWYEEDEHDTGVEPIVHIRALSNLAWLKKPKLCAEFKERELVALCAAALRPTQEIWRRFLVHLESLEKSKRITSDEVTAILVSAMSDSLLREAEEDEEDPEDIDAVTLDEIIDRVKVSYGEQSSQRVREVTNQYEAKLAELEAAAKAANARAESVERTMAVEARKRELFVEGRARSRAHGVAACLHWLVVAVVIAGAIALIVGHPFHTGLVGTVIGVTVVIFVVMELVGILRHVSEWRSSMEARLKKHFRGELSDDAPVTTQGLR